MRVDLRLSVPTPKSFRAAQVRGMYDIPPGAEQVTELRFEAPFDELGEWSIGAIVGASGAGKSSVVRHLWHEAYVNGYEWSGDCILDDFPTELGAKAVVETLTAVGLASAPVWLRPYRVLSTGQQFRATLARALSSSAFVVYDEFTSVVDRTVAIAASAAVAKYVRRSGGRFVAVTCHRDVLPWLEPDWILDMDEQRLARGCLHRPRITIGIYAGTTAAWPLFAGYHYLTRSLDKRARVFLATVTLDGDERLVGFYSLLPALGPRGVMFGWLAGHRTVVLPDFQGLGIGNRLIESVNEWLWVNEKLRVRATTLAPSLIAHRRRHAEMWHLVQAPRMKAPPLPSSSRKQTSAGRLTTTWEYIPEALRRAI